MLQGETPKAGLNSLRFLAEQYPFSSGSKGVDAESIEEAIYSSDEFRMYAYKIKRCTKTRSHDWTECPYAHRGEKATRRDPLKVPYSAVACPLFRNGRCHKADACEYAHGVFEYWLHPARYRTRACNAGRFCQRKVCFFAHAPEQLRTERKYCACTCATPACGTRVWEGIGGGGGSAESSATVGSSSAGVRVDGGSCSEGVSEFLMGLRNLRIADQGIDSDDQLPHLDWISELVK